jgi:hypothetical protein
VAGVLGTAIEAGEFLKAMWAQIINMVLGVWVTAAPAVLGYGRPASMSDHIVGPLVATFACIAIWEVVRPVRWLNVPLGLWLVAAPWLLDHPPSGQLNSMLTGTAIAALSCFGRTIQQRFGGGWSVLWRKSGGSE